MRNNYEWLTANILPVPVVDAAHSSPIIYGWIINSPDLKLHALMLDEVMSYLRIVRHPGASALGAQWHPCQKRTSLPTRASPWIRQNHRGNNYLA